MLKQLRFWTFSTLTLILSVFISIPTAFATDAAWARLTRGGYTVLLQGGDSSGTLSPTTDTTVDCTQVRTLSDRGHQLAQKLGARFAAKAIRIDKVMASPVCNAQETARLAFSGVSVEIVSALGPLADDEAAKQSQIDQIRAMIAEFKSSGNLVMMTDRANITALTGIIPRPTEAVVVSSPEAGETVHIAGRIIFD
ncbi:histidine phosphatase family protein [Phyllobacterium sp. 628]|uniref:histidine phosphatase family protein n=1 Tax=Phyllobacterium sp. 628 TaxID=2718938 RepID=UPI0016627303|nr:histidine phosphatase family protein [Phyllobacterium sp. 628]QND53507.1 histidine phosphatase family protein [Phyllobacterium sp. 628]